MTARPRFDSSSASTPTSLRFSVFLALTSILGIEVAAVAQQAKTLAPMTRLYKEPSESSRLVTEVPAATALQVEWDKPERVQLGEVKRIEAVTRYGIHLVKHGYKAKIFALVPGKQKAAQLWIRIGVPTGNRAWVRSQGVTLLP